MFITLTIDTNQKKKAKKVRMQTRKFNPAQGWRKHIHIKKRNIWQRIKAFRKSLKDSAYRLDGQIAMF